MKKLIAIFTVILSLCLTACGTVEPAGDSSSKPQEYHYLMESIDSDEHTHEAAETPQTVSDPISGYCGNIVTKIVSPEGEHTFWGDDSVTLTDIVINLKYDKPMCKCAAEFSVYLESGAEPYEVNLTGAYVRFGGKHAQLTQKQIDTIRDIYDRQFSENISADL